MVRKSEFTTPKLEKEQRVVHMMHKQEIILLNQAKQIDVTKSVVIRAKPHTWASWLVDSFFHQSKIWSMILSLLSSHI